MKEVEKQTKYIKARISGLDKKKSALKAGYTDSMAHCAGLKIEKKIPPNLWIDIALADSNLMSCLYQGLESYTVNKDGTTSPDFVTRKKYLDMAVKIKKSFNLMNEFDDPLTMNEPRLL